MITGRQPTGININFTRLEWLSVLFSCDMFQEGSATLLFMIFVMDLSQIKNIYHQDGIWLI